MGLAIESKLEWKSMTTAIAVVMSLGVLAGCNKGSGGNGNGGNAGGNPIIADVPPIVASQCLNPTFTNYQAYQVPGIQPYPWNQGPYYQLLPQQFRRPGGFPHRHPFDHGRRPDRNRIAGDDFDRDSDVRHDRDDDSRDFDSDSDSGSVVRHGGGHRLKSFDYEVSSADMNTADYGPGQTYGPNMNSGLPFNGAPVNGPQQYSGFARTGCGANLIPACGPQGGLACVPAPTASPNWATWCGSDIRSNGQLAMLGYNSSYYSNMQACSMPVAQMCAPIGAQGANGAVCVAMPNGGQYGIWVLR